MLINKTNINYINYPLLIEYEYNKRCIGIVFIIILLIHLIQSLSNNITSVSLFVSLMLKKLNRSFENSDNEKSSLKVFSPRAGILRVGSVAALQVHLGHLSES